MRKFEFQSIGCPGKVQRRDLSLVEIGRRMLERKVGKQTKTKQDKKMMDVLDELLLQLVRWDIKVFATVCSTFF